jgi:hypothetical protein
MSAIIKGTENVLPTESKSTEVKDAQSCDQVETKGTTTHNLRVAVEGCVSTLSTPINLDANPPGSWYLACHLRRS